MKLILINLIMLMTFIFLMINHPLMMGLMMMIQTFLISMLLGMMTSSFWFSYILFITFLGGLLVLYIYVCSLASNEQFNFKIIFTSFYFFTIIAITLTINYFLMKNILTFNADTNEFFQNLLIQNMETKIYISKIYNNLTMFITFILMNYLLFTLIVVVKITSKSYGPLRIN